LLLLHLEPDRESQIHSVDRQKALFSQRVKFSLTSYRSNFLPRKNGKNIPCITLTRIIAAKIRTNILPPCASE